MRTREGGKKRDRDRQTERGERDRQTERWCERDRERYTEWQRQRE